MPVADLLRIVCAAEAVLLVATSIHCAIPPMRMDQRIRFAGMALIGFVVVAGQIDGWGKPGNWRMPILAVALGLALIGAVMFLVEGRRRERAEVRDSGT